MSRGSPTPCGRGACVSPSRSISAARKRSAGLQTYDPLDPSVVSWWRIEDRRALQSRPRHGWRRAEGRFRRTRRSVAVRPHARRRCQRGRARAGAARRPHVLSRLRLRPSHGLAEPEERSRPRRLRQLPRPRRQVRRQRRHPDQARTDRLSGPRAGIAAVRRARAYERGDRAADHPGVHGTVAAPGVPRADVERGARFRSPRNSWRGRR